MSTFAYYFIIYILSTFKFQFGYVQQTIKYKTLQMIDDDIRFFRQNFSASSLSDFHDTPKKHPLYQTKNNRLNVPKPKMVSRQVNHQKEEERIYQKGGIQYIESRNINTKSSSQFKILNRLRNEHEEIKHMHPQSQQQSVWLEESDRASQPGRLKFKASKSQKKDHDDERKGRNSASEMKEQRKQREKQRERDKDRDFEKDKDKELQLVKENNQMQSEKAKQLSNKIEQKDRLIKKLRNSEEEIVEQYKSQIKHLKSQIDKLVDQNTGLKKEIIAKDLENKELKQDIARRQNDHKAAILEKQLQFSRSREKQYLETIRMLQEKEQIPVLPSIQMLNQINHLKQTISDNNEEWEKKLQAAIQNEKKIHQEAIQRLEVTNFQIPPTPMSEMVNHHSNFEEVSNHANQFMRTSSPQLANNQNNSPNQYQSSNQYQNSHNYQNPHNPYPNVYVRGPQYEKDRGQRVIELLAAELQHLRRPYNPIQDQLRNIKQSIRALMRRPETSGKQYKDLAVTTDSLHMVSELDNLKMYIIKEQNARRNYNQQVNFYKSQHTVLTEENKQLKTQVATLQESLDVATLENDEYNRTVMQLRIKVQEKSKHIEELASSLANIQTHQVDTYNKIKTNVDRQRSHQLEIEVERLRALLQTEVIQLNKTHDDKIRGLQLHIHNQERKIKDSQQLIRVFKEQIKQLQTQLFALTDKSSKDIAILRQANQRLQQQSITYKSQLTSVATNNHQLQTQVKERTHAIDHLWMVKQAEFDNILGQLVRLREGYI